MKEKVALIFKRISFYFLSFTWGIIPTFVGLIVTTIAACFGRVRTFHGRLYSVIGKDWGGLELGCFFVACESCANSDHLRAHESGHGLQNILFGPLFIFLVWIPSAIRYWYRELKYNRKHIAPPTQYDDIWFEGMATRWGKKYVLTDRI